MGIVNKQQAQILKIETRKTRDEQGGREKLREVHEGRVDIKGMQVDFVDD